MKLFEKEGVDYGHDDGDQKLPYPHRFNGGGNGGYDQ
jgi:hypothetical protein